VPEPVKHLETRSYDAFEDACIEGSETLEHTVTLLDADDRNVVATAMGGRADAIVTANFGDYPMDVLGPLSIEVVHPNDFLLDQLDLPRGSCSTSSESKPPTHREWRRGCESYGPDRNAAPQKPCVQQYTWLAVLPASWIDKPLLKRCRA